MTDQATGTNGGWRGMNGTQRRIAAAFLLGFLLIATLIMFANAESTRSDLERAGVRIRSDLIWCWEWSSMIGWLSLVPPLWIAVARIRPPRFSWPVVILLLAVGCVIASGWHIGMMVGLRQFYYLATDAGPYRFLGGDPGALVYEFRKDIASYLQFVAVAVLAQWIIARAATPPASVPALATLSVSDGAVTHHVPIDEIERVSAAGNYVEIDWRGRILLRRATMAAIAAELGPAFVRVHRAQLVRRDSIRRIETDRSGDFMLELASGASVRGSRRYRAGL